MGIFILLSILILILAIFIFAKKFFYWAKSNLFKNQAAWSGKDIKIKYSKSQKIPESKRNSNYLKIIAEESKFYLDDQSKQEEV